MSAGADGNFDMNNGKLGGLIPFGDIIGTLNLLAAGCDCLDLDGGDMFNLTDEDSVNVTFDPARPGTNVMHIYVLGHDGRPRAVDDADISLTLDGRDIPADLVLSGPGHYTALNQQFPEAGDYAMEIAIDIDGEVRRATATVVIQ